MTARLTIYLELERLMLSVEESDGDTADAIRDAMDPIWYSLTEGEHTVLDHRSIGLITSLEGLRVPVGRDLRYSPQDPTVKRPLPPPTEPIEGWGLAA